MVVSGQFPAVDVVVSDMVISCQTILRERESERVRDSLGRGMWVGGVYILFFCYILIKK